jgi:hypothetical protein
MCEATSLPLARYLKRYLLLLIAACLLAACDLNPVVPGASATPVSVTRLTPTISVATLPSPTSTPSARGRSTGTPTSAVADETAEQENITALVAAMQSAVVAGNKEEYLSYVDLSDPIFAIEHSRWADGWAKIPPLNFALQVRAIKLSSSATAALTIRWKMAASDEQERVATLTVRFTRSPGGSWRYAGEVWIPFQSEHFLVKVMPGLEDVAGELAPELPEVYSHVTGSLDYTPSRNPEIAMTLLNLPNIGGWNEPGEALKFRAARYDPSLKGGIAHEFTHYLTFDRAGTAHTRMPWWLDEGLATYVGSRFDAEGRADERISQVREWVEEGSLADWEAMSDFEATPLELWEYAYPQGYAMVRYITERFGEDTRNRWVAAMATDMEVKQATSEILGLPFDELDRSFVEWIKQQ